MDNEGERLNVEFVESFDINRKKDCRKEFVEISEGENVN